MDLKNFCAEMMLPDGASFVLSSHWEKIVETWAGKLPDFVSIEYFKKNLPYLQVPDDEAELVRRAGEVIDSCASNPARSLYMFAIWYYTFVLKLDPPKELQSSAWGDNEGMAALIIALGCVPLIRENCCKKDIPEHFALEALQWLGGTCGIYKLGHNNIPGHTFRQTGWLRHHTEGELYRIGRFEYLIHHLPEWAPFIFRNRDGVFAVLAAPGMKFDANGLVTLKDAVIESSVEEDGDFITGIPCSVNGIARINEKLTIDKREFKPVFSPWDIVPSIHIPGGMRMGWEETLASMKEAKEFFRRYLKREIPGIVCCSWILNPALEKFAPNGNLARFRREVFALPAPRWGSEGRDGMFFAFGRADVDPTEVQAVNSMQKVLQNIFQAEGTLRTGAMFVLSEDLEKLGSMYYRSQVKVL